MVKTRAQALRLARERYGSSAVVYSHRCMVGRGFNYAVGRVFLGLAVMQLGSGSTWDAAFEQAAQRYPFPPKKEGGDL